MSGVVANGQASGEPATRAAPTAYSLDPKAVFSEVRQITTDMEQAARVGEYGRLVELYNYRKDLEESVMRPTGLTELLKKGADSARRAGRGSTLEMTQRYDFDNIRAVVGPVLDKALSYHTVEGLRANYGMSAEVAGMVLEWERNGSELDRARARQRRTAYQANLGDVGAALNLTHQYDMAEGQARTVLGDNAPDAQMLRVIRNSYTASSGTGVDAQQAFDFVNDIASRYLAQRPPPGSDDKPTAHAARREEASVYGNSLVAILRETGRDGAVMSGLRRLGVMGYTNTEYSPAEAAKRYSDLVSGYETARAALRQAGYAEAGDAAARRLAIVRGASEGTLQMNTESQEYKDARALYTTVTDLWGAGVAAIKSGDVSGALFDKALQLRAMVSGQPVGKVANGLVDTFAASNKLSPEDTTRLRDAVEVQARPVPLAQQQAMDLGDQLRAAQDPGATMFGVVAGYYSDPNTITPLDMANLDVVNTVKAATAAYEQATQGKGDVDKRKWSDAQVLAYSEDPDNLVLLPNGAVKFKNDEVQARYELLEERYSGKYTWMWGQFQGDIGRELFSDIPLEARMWAAGARGTDPTTTTWLNGSLDNPHGPGRFKLQRLMTLQEAKDRRLSGRDLIRRGVRDGILYVKDGELHENTKSPSYSEIVRSRQERGAGAAKVSVKIPVTDETVEIDVSNPDDLAALVLATVPSARGPEAPARFAGFKQLVLAGRQAKKDRAAARGVMDELKFTGGVTVDASGKITGSGGGGAAQLAHDLVAFSTAASAVNPMVPTMTETMVTTAVSMGRAAQEKRAERDFTATQNALNREARAFEGAANRAAMSGRSTQAAQLKLITAMLANGEPLTPAQQALANNLMAVGLTSVEPDDTVTE